MDTQPEPPYITAFLDNALRKALTVKGFAYLAAVFATVVLVVISLRFGFSLATIILGVSVFVALAFLVLLFSRASSLAAGVTAVPLKIIIYTITLIFSGGLVLLATSTFFNGPLPIRDRLFLAVGTEQNVQEVSAAQTEQQIDTLAKERKVSEVIISESQTPPRVSARGIANVLKSRSDGVGYHFILDRDGSVYSFADVAQKLLHTAGHNENSVVIGMAHQRGEVYSPQQIHGLTVLLQSLLDRLQLRATNVHSKEEIRPERYQNDITKYMNEIRTQLK